MGRETIRPTADWSAALRVQKTAECLRQDVPHVSSSHTNDDVLAMFAAESRLIALPVVENGVPVGLINRNQFMDAMARPFHREIYGRKRKKKSCSVRASAARDGCRDVALSEAFSRRLHKDRSLLRS